MKLVKVLTLVFTFIASTSQAELTETEKQEILKLYQAGDEIGAALTLSYRAKSSADSAVNPYPFAQVRTALTKATLALLHAPGSLLGVDSVTVPNSPIPPIDGRPEAIALAYSHLDGLPAKLDQAQARLISAQSNASEAYHAALRDAVSTLATARIQAESFDRTLSYDSPFLDIYPRQFGPHGNYSTAQRDLGEARRLLGYSLVRFSYVANVAPSAADYIACTMRAFSRIHRIILLSGGIPVESEDYGADLEAVAFIQLKIALRRGFLPADFACASRALARDGHQDPQADLLGSWQFTDSWSDRFLKIERR